MAGTNKACPISQPNVDVCSPAALHRRVLPELLAPAGDWACARAAVENGADAVYFGLEKFNARIRAQNFTDKDLPELMQFLHRRGVRGYVTLNTLVFENEIAEAACHLHTMIAAGVDAVIVQDVGICRLIRQLSPDFPIHASTQMTITSAAGMQFARQLGCNLVVLARECSVNEIKLVGQDPGPENRRSASPSILDPRPSTLPLEVFVHGALCVAYSGQCLTSEALGGRSANRGECAQACRMPYDLLADGQFVPLGDRKYLLSPQDLSGLAVLPELVRAGVASLKIEGRLKSPEYVANITRIYRRTLDRLLEQEQTPVGFFERSPLSAPGPDQTRYDLEMAFSRGLYTGWLEGINNQRLVHGRFGKKRGVYLGQVTQVRRNRVAIHLLAPLKPGDGVVFDGGRPEEKEEGGRVYAIRMPSANGAGRPTSRARGKPRHSDDGGRSVELEFGRGSIDFSRLRVGDKVWKTSDPELDRRLRRTFEGEAPKFRRPIALEVSGAVGKPLTLIARDDHDNAVRVDSVLPLVHAEARPLTTGRLVQQLGRLGGTPLRLGELKNHLSGELLLPLSELNRLRREAVAALEELRSQPKRWTLHASRVPIAGDPPGESLRTRQNLRSHARDPQLIVLARNLGQLEAALRSGVETVYCDFENPKKYRDAVHACRRSGGKQPSGAEPLTRPHSRPATVFVAPPRVFKTGEEWTLEQVRSCGADGYLVRNYDHLNFFADDRRIGDYTFNVANRLAADYFKNRFSLERVTASYDLDYSQLEALLQAAPAEWFEVTIHQHMPMFHMEHCIFCAFLSNGTDYTNCGRPCDKHEVKLRDRVGAEHPVKADVGCRNTVFNSLAQTGAEYVSKMLELGVRYFRIEFLNETPEQAGQTIAKYQQLLRGEISGTQLWRELRLFNQLGVTRGQMAGARV